MSNFDRESEAAGQETGHVSRTLAERVQRKPYEKPQLYTIGLAAEEVMSVGCKLSGGPGGPIGANCTAASCFAAGS